MEYWNVFKMTDSNNETSNN